MWKMLSGHVLRVEFLIKNSGDGYFKCSGTASRHMPCGEGWQSEKATGAAQWGRRHSEDQREAAGLQKGWCYCLEKMKFHNERAESRIGKPFLHHA